MEKVFVGTCVSDKKAYCLDRFIENCNNLTYLNREHFFVDNSEDRNFCIENIILKHGIDCDWISSSGKRSVQYITESQNVIRKKLLEGDYTHLLFLESDLFPKPNIIEELLSYTAPFVVGRYFLGNMRYEKHLIGSEIENTWGKITNRNISDVENYFEYGSGKSRSSMFGFGIAMFEKNLVLQTPFFIDEASQSHSDSSYYFFLKDRGIIPIVHDVITPHENSDWGFIFEQEKRLKN